MSRCRGLGAQQFIQAKAGFVSVAALLCLSAPVKLLAQDTQQQPSSPPQPSPQQPSSQQETTLPPVDVDVPRRRPPPRRRPAVAQPAPAPAPLPATETTTQAQPAVTGYRANTSGIGRLPVPLRDTPQTVNVVTPQIIQEQRANTMEDALRAIPGITFSAGEGAQQGDGPIIRGFVARSDLFRDGMRDPGWYTRDLFSADRVEVYKGPSAFAFGRGATGGAINTVSKLPTGVPFVEGTITGTTGPGVRAELDASGKNGIWSGRIAALGMELDTPTRDHVWTKRWGVAPSVAVDLGERTKATLSYVYQGPHHRGAARRLRADDYDERVATRAHLRLPQSVGREVHARQGLQLSHSLIAFGRGEIFGQGLGGSVEKLHYLPEAHTDFLLAVIGEEVGFVGVAAVIVAFFWLTRRVFQIGRQAIALDRVFAGLFAGHRHLDGRPVVHQHGRQPRRAADQGPDAAADELRRLGDRRQPRRARDRAPSRH